MNIKNWILILILLLVLSFSVPSLREKTRSTGNIIGFDQQTGEFASNLDFEKRVKLREIKRYIESSSESFTPEECKQLLKEWQPDIKNLEFISMDIADQAFINISGGRRTITFIYTQDNSFEGCNILDTYDIDLDEKESEIERYFDCEKESCKEYKFKNGRFLYVYDTSDNYNILKYLLRVKGKPGVEPPNLTFQILYIQRNMTSFIQHRINRARQGYGCG